VSPSEVGLLRSLVQWRRSNGWTREYRPWDADQHDHTYEHKDSGLSVEATMHRIELIPGEPKVVYEVGVEACGHVLFHGWPWSVRSAVNGIAAAEVIPPEMAPMHSSAFQAGRESAYDGGKVEWAARCTNPGCGHRDDEAPFWPRRDRGNVEMYISRQIPGMYELVRQVTSPWVRVPEAGDGDA
jgi:hypothetical protein